MKKKKVPPILEKLKQIDPRISVASEVDGSYILRRPCGLFSLDLHTAGGLPAGSMTEIAGPEGIGKNFLANQYIAKCQEIYGNDAKIFVAITEYKYDKAYARRCGVKIACSPEEIKEFEKASGIKLSDREKDGLRKGLGQFYIIQGLSAEKTLEAVLECLKSKQFQIGIIDSLSSMIPADEVEKDMNSSSRIGSIASLQTKFMGKFYYAVGEVTSLIILNQVRAPIGQYVPKGRLLPLEKYRIPTSCAVKHGLVARILLTYGGEIRAAGSNKSVGKIIRWEITKGKAGFHEGPFGQWYYYYDKGIDKLQDFIDAILPLADRRGSYYDLFGKTFHGREAINQFFRDNPDKIKEFMDKAFVAKGIRYRWK